MIIVSQNKRMIVSIDNLNYIKVEEEELNYRNYIYIITNNIFNYSFVG